MSPTSTEHLSLVNGAADTPTDLDFNDLTPVRIPLPIAGKRYWLTDASADAVVRWRNNLISKSKPGPDGKPISYGAIADGEPLLVSLCLYGARPDGTFPANDDGEPDVRMLVSEKQIRKWPNRVQKRLFAKIKEVSDLDEPETEEILRKRFEETRQKLNALKASQASGEEAAGDPLGDGSGNGAATSATVES